MREMWEYSILQCFNSLGGRAYLRQIYDKIGNFVELTEEHLKIEYRRPAYHHQIRRHITNLCRSGDLVKISRGYYSLTKKGRERLIRERPIKI